MTLIIDAENMVLGRLSSEIAKYLLRETENVIVINAEKCLITGNPRYVVEKYRRRAAMKTKTNPLRGPFYPRSPTKILKRTVRGMLPWKQAKGKEAYSRLKVFLGYPEEIRELGVSLTRFVAADGSNLKRKCMTVGEVASRIGTYDPSETAD